MELIIHRALYAILVVMAKSDIKKFIDFFYDASIRIRHEKSVIYRGKDGKLVKSALIVFSRPQLEMLALWFLAKKPKLAPAVGTMLSKIVLSELQDRIRSARFWKDLDSIYERYYGAIQRQQTFSKIAEFNKNDVMELQKRLW